MSGVERPWLTEKSCAQLHMDTIDHKIKRNKNSVKSLYCVVPVGDRDVWVPSDSRWWWRKIRNSPPPTDTLVYNYIWDNFLLKKNLKAGWGMTTHQANEKNTTSKQAGRGINPTHTERPRTRRKLKTPGFPPRSKGFKPHIEHLNI